MGAFYENETAKKQIMDLSVEDLIIDAVKKGGYKPDEFEKYQGDAGWEYWMNSYTEAEDGEECSESELREINKIQAQAFIKAFPNEKFNISFVDYRVIVSLL